MFNIKQTSMLFNIMPSFWEICRNLLLGHLPVKISYSIFHFIWSFKAIDGCPMIDFPVAFYLDPRTSVSLNKFLTLSYLNLQIIFEGTYGDQYAWVRTSRWVFLRRNCYPARWFWQKQLQFSNFILEGTHIIFPVCALCGISFELPNLYFFLGRFQNSVSRSIEGGALFWQF